MPLCRESANTLYTGGWNTEVVTSAEASLPVMSYVIVVGPPSLACSKVTVPETLESPRTTATSE